MAAAGGAHGQTPEGAPPGLPERIAAWKARHPGQAITTSISFDRLVPDAQVTVLGRRYGVRVNAVRIWVGGFTGTHRIREGETPEVAISQARQEVVRSFRSGGGVERQARTFVERVSEQEVASSEERLVQARSLLAVNHRFRGALNGLERGIPLIYGLEVTGDPDRIAEMIGAPNVASVDPAFYSGEILVVPPARLPDAIRGPFAVPEIDRLTPAQAYAQLRALANSRP